MTTLKLASLSLATVAGLGCFAFGFANDSLGRAASPATKTIVSHAVAPATGSMTQSVPAGLDQVDQLVAIGLDREEAKTLVALAQVPPAGSALPQPPATVEPLAVPPPAMAPADAVIQTPLIGQPAICESPLCESPLCESPLCEEALCEEVVCEEVVCEEVLCETCDQPFMAGACCGAAGFGGGGGGGGHAHRGGFLPLLGLGIAALAVGLSDDDDDDNEPATPWAP